MVKGDIFTSPIDFALQETMKRFENSDNKNDKFIFESLRRTKVMWEHIRVHGLDMCGMTYEQFCNQLDEKRNIVLMSDDELNNFNKAIQIMNIIKS